MKVGRKDVKRVHEPHEPGPRKQRRLVESADQSCLLSLPAETESSRQVMVDEARSGRGARLGHNVAVMHRDVNLWMSWIER